MQGKLLLLTFNISISLSDVPCAKLCERGEDGEGAPVPRLLSALPPPAR